MTPDLFARTGLADSFRRAAFCLWDVGARGGIDPHFAPFAFAIDAVGFEPDPAACAALTPSGAWRSEVFFETALAGTSGPQTLHIPRDPAGASLLPHDPAIGARYGLDDLFHVQETVDIAARTMDKAVAGLGVPAPRLLKLDVEGLELDILQGGRQTLAGVVAVKLEAGFMRFRKYQPLAGELIAFMAEEGFCLADIIDPARWRKRPWAGDPYSVRRDPAYSRGRLAQADLVFLREPDTVTLANAETAALAAMGLGYFDHGLELLACADDPMTNRYAIDDASRRYGRARAKEELRNTLAHFCRLARSLAGRLNVPPAAR